MFETGSVGLAETQLFFFLRLIGRDGVKTVHCLSDQDVN